MGGRGTGTVLRTPGWTRSAAGRAQVTCHPRGPPPRGCGPSGLELERVLPRQVPWGKIPQGEKQTKRQDQAARSTGRARWSRGSWGCDAGGGPHVPIAPPVGFTRNTCHRRPGKEGRLERARPRAPGAGGRPDREPHALFTDVSPSAIKSADRCGCLGNIKINDSVPWSPTGDETSPSH